MAEGGQPPPANLLLHVRHGVAGMVAALGLVPMIAAVSAVLAARHVGAAVRHAAKAPVESVRAKVALMSLNLVIGILRKVAGEIDWFH